MDQQNESNREPSWFGMTRRSAIAALGGLAAVCGSAACRLQASEQQWGHGGRPAADNIYTRWFGLRPSLSCQEHRTAIGGTRMPAEVMRAMNEANDYFIDMIDLNQAAGEYIAGVMGAEDALVSAGAFSSMLLGAAACLTGTDPARIEALPHPTWEKMECLTQTQHRFPYDRAYRAAGMKIVESDTKQGLIDKISNKTAMIAVLGLVDRQEDPSPGTLMPQELIEIGKRHGVPVVVNLASEVLMPPPDNLTRYTKAGADLVLISGGKGLLGPQSSGILAGRKDLIEAARLNHSPYNSVGRGMKVDRGEIVGLVAAIKRYVALDHEVIIEKLNRKARYIADTLNRIPSMTAELEAKIVNYGRFLKLPFDNVYFRWDQSVIPLSGGEAAAQLRAGEPSILIYGEGKAPQANLTTQYMADGEEIFAARGLEKFFRGKVRRG